MNDGSRVSGRAGVRRWGTVGLAASLLLLGAAACGDDDGEVTAAPTTSSAASTPLTAPPVEECREPTKITQATISTTYLQTYMFVADELDLWEENCVVLDDVDLAGTAQTTMFVAGEGEYGQFGPATVSVVIAQDLGFERPSDAPGQVRLHLLRRP